jgi:hypothetical protein
VLVLLSGLPLQRVGIAMAGLVVFVVLAYFFYPNATHRIDSFFSGGTAFDQVDLAQKTLLNGGWTGTGLWLGVKKLALFWAPNVPDGTDLAELDTALNDLESVHERMAKVVELRYFVGLEVTEVAATLGITERTARRDWVAAREWLRDRLGQSA